MDRIHHVAIQVEDLEKTLAWYKNEFEVEVTYQDDSWAMIKFENVSLALVLPNQHPGHFAIESAKAGSYGELTYHRDGTSSVYIKDPSGNSVEMLKLGKNND